MQNVEHMALKIFYLDASAIVMHIDSEPGVKKLGEHLDHTMPWHTTSLCVAEALGVFKRKHLKTDRLRYLAKCGHLFSYLHGETPRLHLDEEQLLTSTTFYRSWEYTQKYGIDISDALQLDSLKHGRFSFFVGESQSVLLTVDKALAKAAEAENLQVRYCGA
jgi:predicted nucleic acid-binding protein